VCASSASTGLCGGQRATAVPTATQSPPDPPTRRGADYCNPRGGRASPSVRASRRLSAAASAESGTGCGSRPWLIDSRSPVCSAIPATISKTGSAEATLRPPLSGHEHHSFPPSLETSSLDIRLHRLCRVCLILTRTSFAAECIQIEFARTTIGSFLW
jgi:hypothetical protein